MCLFAETGLTTALFLAALVLTIGLLLSRSSRYFARRSESESASYRIDAPDAVRKGHHLESPEPVVQWEVQMHETARELSGQLDTKLSLLQQLVNEADRAAARLEAALAAARNVGAGADSGAGGPADSTGRERLDRLREGASQAEALRLAGLRERREPAGEPGRAEPSAPASEKLSPERRFQEIYTLADYGFDAAEIAHRLGTPVGEVELILGLRGKR